MNDFVHSNDDRPALILNIRDRTGSQLLHGAFENESRLLSEGVCFGTRWHISSFLHPGKTGKPMRSSQALGNPKVCSSPPASESLQPSTKNASLCGFSCYPKRALGRVTNLHFAARGFS